MSKTVFVYPRNTDHGRLKPEESILLTLPEDQQRIFTAYLAFFKGKIFIGEIVFRRWLSEVHEIFPEVPYDIIVRIAAESFGFHSWREMLSRRCTLEMFQTRRSKLGLTRVRKSVSPKS